MARLPWIAVLLVACSSATSADGDGSLPRPDTGLPTVEIGTRASGAVFTPWHDGDRIPLAWGPQGGVMITPAVAIDGRLISGTDPGLDVTLSNLRADRTPFVEFPGVGPVRGLFGRIDTRLVDGPFFDQLGWSETPGLPMIVRARVMGMGIDAVGEVAITLAPSGTSAPDANDAPDLGTIDAGP